MKLNAKIRSLLDAKCGALKITSSETRRVFEGASQQQADTGITGQENLKRFAARKYFSLFESKIKAAHAEALNILEACHVEDSPSEIPAYVDSLLTPFVSEANSKVIELTNNAPYSSEIQDIPAMYSILKRDFEYRVELAIVAKMTKSKADQHIEIKSHNQSGGITVGHIGQYNAAPETPEKPTSKLQKLSWITGSLAAIAAVLLYFGLSPAKKEEPPQSQPHQTMEIKKSDTSVKSEAQSGGVTAGSIGTVNNFNNTMQPQVEGVRIYTRQISSPREDAPYAIEITVQVSGTVEGFGLAVICDKEIVQGTFEMNGNSNYERVADGGHLNAHPKTSYVFSFRKPSLTPGTPLLVKIMCKEPFNIIGVQRIPPML